MKPWPTRIPAAIADGEKLLDDAEYVLMPPHMWGNDTNITLVLTAGEVAMADWAWETFYNSPEYNGERTPPPPVLIAFCEKIEKVSHD